MNRMKNFLKYSLPGLLLSLLLTACDSSADKQLKAYIAEVKQRPAIPIEPIPEFMPLPKFNYPENEVRRNSFEPKKMNQQEDKLAPNLARPKQDLERFPLDSLKFVGILKQDDTVWALISRPDDTDRDEKVITRVKAGGFMGQDYGKVLKIDSNKLELEETINLAGKWERKTTILHINANK